MQRVMGFVDGFNLYYGLRTKFGRKYHWLDLQLLVDSLLKDDQRLVKIKYYTARVRDDRRSQERQACYLDALNANCDRLEVIDGRFQRKSRECRNCRQTSVVYEEKETDVAIAVELVEHGVNDDFDTALLISADSDLCPAVRSLGRLCPAKRVVAVFPPARQSAELAKTARASFRISEAKIRQAQLPAKVMTDAGVVLERPAHWR